MNDQSAPSAAAPETDMLPRHPRWFAHQPADEVARLIAAGRAAAMAGIELPISDPVVAYTFLTEHPVRGADDTSFLDMLEFAYVRVDPATGRIMSDGTRNTATAVWLESGPGSLELGDGTGRVSLHDPRLDCGAPTFEAALVILANRVGELYGPTRKLPR